MCHYLYDCTSDVYFYRGISHFPLVGIVLGAARRTLASHFIEVSRRTSLRMHPPPYPFIQWSSPRGTSCTSTGEQTDLARENYPRPIPEGIPLGILGWSSMPHSAPVALVLSPGSTRLHRCVCTQRSLSSFEARGDEDERRRRRRGRRI